MMHGITNIKFMNSLLNMTNLRAFNVETTLAPFDIPQHWISSEKVP